MHDTYASPYSYRYGSEAMRGLFSEETKRLWWRQVWLALVISQEKMGIVPKGTSDEVRKHCASVDVARSLEVEKTTRHDVMAELSVFSEQCGESGRVLHLGATSSDIVDNSEVLRVRAALRTIRHKLEMLLRAMADFIRKHADVVTMAWTHIQPAEPTTVGYRFSQYAQDLLDDLMELDKLIGGLRGKGFKGACGTSASYAELTPNPGNIEKWASTILGIDFFDVATQTAPRKQDYKVMCVLAGIAQSLSRMAFDVRMLQSPLSGEWAEEFSPGQVGSSAMPFKRNPISAENICSMARMVANQPRLAWDNAAQGILERTLDDSANRRNSIPETILMIDEMLMRAESLISKSRIDTKSCRDTMSRFGEFSATERVLMVATRNGGDRQELHGVLKEHSLSAWDRVRSGESAGLTESLLKDERVMAWLSSETELRELMNADGHVGLAVSAAIAMAEKVSSHAGV